MKSYKFDDSWVQFIDGILSVLVPCKDDNSYICEGTPVPFTFTVPSGYGSASGSKRILWKYNFTNKNLELTDSFEFANGDKLEIFRVGRVGREIPDISTYWVAYVNGQPYDLEYRGSMWRSDDCDYPNWISHLKSELGKPVVSVA